MVAAGIAAGGSLSAPAQARTVAGTAMSAGLPAATYSLPRTRACLLRRGATMTTRRASDRWLRSLRDLAQKTSFGARVGRAVVGIAFTRGASHAELLVELLRAPANPYRIVRRGNAVVLVKPGARVALVTVTRCLTQP